MPRSLLDRLIQVRELHLIKDKILLVDDVNRIIIRRKEYGTIENLKIYGDTTFEPFPYSHHIS
jgi:hypothetical protein